MDRMGGVGRTIPQRQDSNTPVGDQMSLSRLTPSAALEGGGVAQVAPQTVPTGGGGSRGLGDKIAGFFRSLGEGLAQAGRGLRDLFQGLFAGAGRAPATGTATGPATGPTPAEVTEGLNDALVNASRIDGRDARETALHDAAMHAVKGRRDDGSFDPKHLVPVMGSSTNHLSDAQFDRLVSAATAMSHSAVGGKLDFMHHVMALPKPSERALADLEQNLRAAERSGGDNPLGSFMRGNADYSSYTAGLMRDANFAPVVSRSALGAAHGQLGGAVSAAARDATGQELRTGGATATTAPVMRDVARSLLETLLSPTGPGSARAALTPEARAHLAAASQAVVRSSLSPDDKISALNKLFADALFLRTVMPELTLQAVPAMNLPDNERTLIQQGVNLALCVASDMTSSSKMSADLRPQYESLFATMRPRMEQLFIDLGRPTPTS